MNYLISMVVNGYGRLWSESICIKMIKNKNVVSVEEMNSEMVHSSNIVSLVDHYMCSYVLYWKGLFSYFSYTNIQIKLQGVDRFA